MEWLNLIQEDWLKTYFDLNTKLRQKAKNNFEKDFFKLMNNSVFGKTMENIRKYRGIKLVTTEKARNYLVSESNYNTKKFFKENLLAIEMKKTSVLMNKPVYLGLSILDLSKTVMYEFWYDYVKPKYDEKAKLCYIDTDSFIVHVKTDDIYKDITEDVEKNFDTSNYEIHYFQKSSDDINFRRSNGPKTITSKTFCIQKFKRPKRPIFLSKIYIQNI